MLAATLAIGDAEIDLVDAEPRLRVLPEKAQLRIGMQALPVEDAATDPFVDDGGQRRQGQAAAVARPRKDVLRLLELQKTLGDFGVVEPPERRQRDAPAPPLEEADAEAEAVAETEGEGGSEGDGDGATGEDEQSDSE